MLKSFGSMLNSVALGLVLAGATLVGAASADPHDFRFVNANNSASIMYAWMAPAGTTAPWKSIGLSGPIGPGGWANIDVSGGGGCVYDLKVLLSDGDVQYFSNANLCKLVRLIVT
jgi:hypothetical protein